MNQIRDYIYDLESYPNIFTCCIADATDRVRWVYEISTRKDQRDLMIDKLRELKRNKGRMVGYNNIAFDYPLLHFILKNQQCSVTDIHAETERLIKRQNISDTFQTGIPKKDWLIPQLDLLKIWHFDNKAKMTSLKMLEFNMRSEDIQDLPFKPGTYLTDREMDELIKYNKHDVYQTFLFYEKTLPAIEFRAKLSEQYGKDFSNHNDTKIGKDYFVMQLEKADKGCCYKYNRQEGSWQVQQTKRDSINLGEVILPYIHFERPELNALKNWFSQQTIFETKGVFTNIHEHDLGDLAKYAKLTPKRAKLKEKPTDEQIAEFKEEWPCCWIEERLLKSGKTSYYRCWNIAESLNVVVEGFTYVHGVGGIHAAKNNSVNISDDNKVVKSADISSFYPNLAIRNRLHPEHLGELFCDIYEDVYELRKTFPKSAPENAVMKLALNGTYGASNDKFSPFYDPKFTMAITVNGQLSLLMLVEMLLKVPTIEIIMANTDGIEYIVDRDYSEQTDDVCKRWETLTQLQLEFDEYNKLLIRDVNNYTGVFIDGKTKRKGAYEYVDLGWHQNQSELVVKKCAEKVLMEGVDPLDFLMNHKDIFDFCLRTKVPRSSRLVTFERDDHGNELNERVEQNISRYIMTKKGRYLRKIMPPLAGKVDDRNFDICSGYKVTICNKMSDFKGEIDYDYYLMRVNKLTQPILTGVESEDDDSFD